MSVKYERFGKYVLLENIATGGMAEIFLARATAADGLNKFVAIKRMRKSLIEDKEFLSMFKEEAKVVLNLNHSNVVSFFDFSEHNGQYYLVMEYVEGHTIKQTWDVLKKHNKHFSTEQALYIIKEAAAGLDYAHRCVDATTGASLNIIHRDISPQNIMMTFEGEVKIIDFGIAKSEAKSDKTETGTIFGKFSYMSPEQAFGKIVDARTDIFALGVVAWELLANDRLFVGKTDLDTLTKVRLCQMTPLRKVNPSIPVEVEKIVMKMLSKKPEDRYQSAEDLFKDLNRVFNIQFPEFSKRQLSEQFKSLFKDVYDQNRVKLKDYAALKFETPPVEVVETSTKEASKPEDISVKQSAPHPVQQPLQQRVRGESIHEYSSGEENLFVSIHDSHNVKSDLPEGFSDAEFKTPTEKIKFNNLLTEQQPIKEIKFEENLKKYNPNDANLFKFEDSVPIKEEPKNSGNFWQHIIALSIVGLAFYVAFNVFFSEKKSIKKGSKTKENVVSNENQKRNITSIPKAQGKFAKVFVNSSPIGADIYINGIDIGKQTPSEVSVNTDTEVSIMVKKSGFLEFHSNRVFNDKEQFLADLRPAIEKGFLNIITGDLKSYRTIVINGKEYLGEKDKQSRTKIYVDGKDVMERSPVLGYPIDAGKEVIVSAFNPDTQKYDEVKIKVEADKTIDVQLILGRITKVAEAPQNSH